MLKIFPTILSFVLFCLIIFANYELKAENNNSKKPASCRSEQDSYKKYVKQAKGHSEKDKTNLKKHLRCWKDKEVMLKLAKIYVEKKEFYLAKKVYEEAGAEKELQLIEIILKDLDTPENKKKFIQQSLKIAKDLKKEAKEQKQLAVTLITVGSLFAGAGFGLFLNGRIFDGIDPKPAYYPLMFAGLSLIGGGVTINYSADYKKAQAETYLDIANNHYDIGATPSQHYEFSGKGIQTKKRMIKNLKIHGTSLVIISIPLFVISAFSIYDAVDWIVNSRPLSDDIGDSIALGLVSIGFIIIGEIATLIPGIACLAGGIKMITYSNKWQKTNKPKTVIELTNLSPIINPITKTYGISMGFSF